MRSVARALAAVLGFFLLQEVATRAVFPQPEVVNFDRGRYSHMGFTPDEADPIALGHLSFTWRSEPDGFAFVHALNLYGFRDVEWTRQKPAGTTRLAFLGDSFVEGFSAEAEDGIPARVRRARPDLDVLNLGIGGGDLPAYAQLLRDAIAVFAPDEILLVLFANDVLPLPVDPAWRDAALVPEPADPWRPRALAVIERLRAGLWSPRRWHEPPFEFLPAVPDPRNPWSDGRTAGRLQAFVEPEIARAIREGAFNPMLVDALPWFRKHLQRPHSIGGHVLALGDHGRAHGASLRVAYIPTKNQVSDRYLEAQARFSPADSVASQMGDAFQVHARLLARDCTAAGVPFLDLTPTLRKAEDSGRALYWDHDDHMRPEGYGVAAEAILAWLASAELGAER